MSEAIAIPSIIETLDPDTPHSAQPALLRFLQVLQRLDEWYDATRASSTGPLWWLVSGTTPPGDTKLSFPDITVANYMTHFWAFSIICLTHITKLRRQLPERVEWEWMIRVHGQVPDGALLEEEVVGLAVRILRSAEYLLQDEMQFYGIASASFPLRTAWEALDGLGVGGEACWESARTIELIVQKGYEDVLMPCTRMT